MFNQNKKQEILLIKQIVVLIVNLKKNDIITIQDIDKKINELFPFFVSNYPVLYQMVITNDKLDILYKMIENLEDICDNKKELDNVREELGENLAEVYLYPKFGKPQKK